MKHTPPPSFYPLTYILHIDETNHTHTHTHTHTHNVCIHKTHIPRCTCTMLATSSRLTCCTSEAANTMASRLSDSMSITVCAGTLTWPSDICSHCPHEMKSIFTLPDQGNDEWKQDGWCQEMKSYPPTISPPLCRYILIRHCSFRKQGLKEYCF